MKTLKALDVLIAALALAAYAGPAQASREDLLPLNLMDGNVQVKTEDTGDWVSRRRCRAGSQPGKDTRWR